MSEQLTINRIAFEHTSRRTVRVVKAPLNPNETPTAKLHRVVIATVRGFAREFPDEMMRIVTEEIGELVVK